MEAGVFFLKTKLVWRGGGTWKRREGKENQGLVGEEDRLKRWRRGGEAGGGGLPFSPFHSGWLPACVSGCVVTFDPGAGGLQWQRQL